MSDPAEQIQAAIFAALNAEQVCGGRIHDDVPESPEFPYVTIGEGDDVNTDNSCFDATEVNVTVHVWSRAVGFLEAKRIAGDIRHILKRRFALEGFRIVEAEHAGNRWIRDPDGKTRHAACQFRYDVVHLA